MDAFTFQKRRGTSYVRKKPIPTDTKTEAQLFQRQIYRDAVAAWNALTVEEKEAWRGQCPRLTAYQCFLRSELKYVPPPPPPVEYTEEQTQSNAWGGLVINEYRAQGQRLTISNRKVTKLAFLLYRYKATSGTVTFTIRKASDNSVIASKLWGNAAALPTVATWLEVEFDDPPVVNQQVKILAEVSGIPAGYAAAFRYYYGDVKPGENMCYNYNGTWGDYPASDATYRYKYFLP